MTGSVMRAGPAAKSFAIILALALSGCTPLGIVAGAGAGVTVGTAAAQERGVGGTARDAQIRVEITDKWFRQNVDLMKGLNLQIYEGRVLISGVVQDMGLQEDAVRIAWQPPGVRDVINEIEVRNSGGIQEYARDSWIATQLRAKLLFAKDVYSLNYSVESVGGTVYLLGLAQDQKELDLVQQAARTTPRVKKVVSHVLIKGDPRRKQI